MDISAVENATRLAWRSAPELLINEESLVDVIVKLRTQVQALERNELLSGTALPAWLLRALTDVANNVDAVVECQALNEQVNGLQKEVLELRHELLLQQSASGSSSSSSSSLSSGFTPTPHHRLSAGGLRAGGAGAAASASQRRLSTVKNLNGSQRVAGSADGIAATAENGSVSDLMASGAGEQQQQLNMELTLKPLWDAIHRQTNSFSALKQNFTEAKETVARLQSEIKRRDAVVQARNAKHESVVQTQVEKLNEAMRACVTRNDLIASEQRIAQQMKADRLHVLEEVDTRSNKMLEDLLASRSDQEDINSQNAEQLEGVARKQARMEDHIIELMKRHTEGQETINEMRVILSDAVAKVDANASTIDVFQDKVASFEDTQRVVSQLTEDLATEKAENERLRDEQETRLVDKIGESAAAVRSELAAVNGVVMQLVDMNLDSELKTLASKLDVVQLSMADATRKLTHQQKQLSTHEEHSKTQFVQVFDSLDRVMATMSAISEESMRLSYNLNQSIEHGNALQKDVADYKDATNKSLTLLHRSSQELQSGLERHSKATENEIGVIKNQLFHAEDAHSNLRRDLETTQHELEVNWRSQREENTQISGSITTLFRARDDLNMRQDAAQAQMMAMQADNRNEIHQATVKLVAIVDKESDRVEALYRSFQEKQDHFADVVARSSIRNMELSDMNRELDRISELFVTECWKFETSARTSTKSSARDTSGNSNNQMSGGSTTTRKLFNERQQQLLAKNCQFFADLMVARAEYEVLHSGCNKEIKSQCDLDDLMLDAQVSIVEKMKMKIQAKIMNNKNIGEQFDKSTLDRRELYMDTLRNIIDASMKRRTMGASGNGGGRFGGGRQSMFGDMMASDDPASGGGGSFLEGQRLVATSSGSAIPGSRRKSSSRKPSSAMSGAMVGSASAGSGLTSELDANRVSFSPGSAYVYRAGFRLPKAAQSPPNSPGGSLTGAVSASRLGSAAAAVAPLAALLENGEGTGPAPTLFLPTAFDSDAPPSTVDSSSMHGWAADGDQIIDGGSGGGGGGGLSKSISLPALRQ